MLVPVIGIEVHVELKSKSKVFSSSLNDFNAPINTNISLIDLAYPGTLPKMNKEVVDMALKAALTLNCKINKKMHFDRKNYFYPDLPKGYQITQSTNPIGINGKLIIDVDGKTREIEILDIHLEEDSASLDHYSDTTNIDYNRAGVPLLETVTAPCMNSASEAVAFLDSMKNIFRYTDISDADVKRGQIRCDVNVNLFDEQGNKVTPKVEVKNVNNITNVENTINYEIKRQTELVLSGKKDEVVQETRRYDEATNTTISMRSKADAVDYKYFVEPNIPPYKISSELINKIKAKIPVLPNEKKIKYINELGLNNTDATIIIKDKKLSEYFDELVNIGCDAKYASNWIINNVLDYLNSHDISLENLFINPIRLKFIIDQVVENKINNKQAKELFMKSLELEREPKELISELGMEQLNNEDELKSMIINILDNNKSQVEQYKNGKTNMFQYFVGQVMKETKGKANPVIVKDILTNELNNR